MSDEEIKQRIAYLVQHGGLYDDPLSDLRRGVRWAISLSGLAFVVSLIDLFT